MKKLTLTGLLSLCAAGAFAQGTLIVYNDETDLVSPIYSPQLATPTVMLQGDSDASLAASGYTAAQGSAAAAEAAVNPTGGPVVYTGTPIGGSSYSGAATVGAWATIPNLYTYGNLFSVQVYALSAGDAANANSVYSKYQTAGGTPATGDSQLPAFSSLSPMSQYVTTMAVSGGSANQGFMYLPTVSSDPGIPGTGYFGNGTSAQKGIHAGNYMGSASVAAAAWYNAGGTIASLYGTPAEILAGASYASPASDSALGLKVPYGISAVFLDSNLGEPASVNNAAGLNSGAASQAADMSNLGNGGLTSFSFVLVPEPSTIALCVLGACAFLARRRK